ncbi:hypothetical protein F53441_702 [Fusarium austroafricanum]|uniref:Uncharacterized protein n=1 Tax=Fusarium austroafricanum TaxID=2364996 RepID=A0A8H4KX40_9HYPO|nr:hypothetical protein F53441_702 [Fusarium austroafricanum]
MSNWRHKLSDTVKMGACRDIALSKGYAMLGTLHLIHQIAIQHASPESILVYCSLCALPPQNQEELEALKEPEGEKLSTEEGNLSSLDRLTDGTDHSVVQLYIDEEIPDYADLWDLQAGIAATDCFDNFDCDSDESTFDEDEDAAEATQPINATKDDPGSNNWLTNIPGVPYEDVNPVIPSDTGDGYANSWLTNTDDTPYDGVQAATSPGTHGSEDYQWLTNTPGSPYNMEKASSSSDGHDTASVPVELEVAVVENNTNDINNVNGIIEEGDEWSTDDWYDSDSSWDRSESVTASDDSDPEFRTSTLSSSLKDYWPARLKASLDQLALRGSKKDDPVVNSMHLLKLRDHISDALHFRDSIQRNIDIVNAESRERKDVYYDVPSGSPMRLRSHGLGSALRYVITIDQEWGDEDNWGMPPPKKTRKRI